jgi:glycosyltransferase involved in cell wall biosynthesis
MVSKFEPIDDVCPPPHRSTPTIAVLPAGCEVWEDFLDSIGVSLERFCHEVPCGWMLGYMEALGRAGVRTVLILLSARISSPLRFRHAASGAVISVLPVPTTYRTLRQKLIGSRSVLAETSERLPNYKRRARDTLFGVLDHLTPHLSTPLGLLRRELRREGCAAILCQEYEHFRFDTAILLGRLLRLPVFATFQGSTVELNAISRALRPLTIRGCSALFVAPTTEIERVRARYKVEAARVVQIFNPIDVESWRAEGREEARATYKLPPDARVAVWHGRVSVEQKGLDILLEAWEEVCHQRPGQTLRLLLMGSGPDVAQIRPRIASLANVLWIDEYVTDRDVIRRFLSAGDVYAFPSRYEGFAVAPLEAMACGLPVVAAQASGVSDIFAEGEASGGIVVPRGDAAAFARALGRVLDDAALGHALGRLARRRVEAAFSLEAIGLKLRSVLLRSGISAAASKSQRDLDRPPIDGDVS